MSESCDLAVACRAASRARGSFLTGSSTCRSYSLRVSAVAVSECRDGLCSKSSSAAVADLGSGSCLGTCRSFCLSPCEGGVSTCVVARDNYRTVRLEEVDVFRVRVDRHSRDRSELDRKLIVDSRRNVEYERAERSVLCEVVEEIVLRVEAIALDACRGDARSRESRSRIGVCRGIDHRDGVGNCREYVALLYALERELAVVCSVEAHRPDAFVADERDRNFNEGLRCCGDLNGCGDYRRIRDHRDNFALKSRSASCTLLDLETCGCLRCGCYDFPVAGIVSESSDRCARKDDAAA